MTRRAVLESFGRAVARDALLVAGNPEMLWQQLYNRVQWDPDVRELLRGELERRSRPGGDPWLRLATHVPESPALRASVPILGAAVRACAIAPGGDFVVTAGGDRTGADWAVRIWEPETWERRFYLEGHRDPVDACAVSPDGRYVVSTGAYSHEGKAMMFVWDPHTGETLAGPLIVKSSTPGGLAVSPDGRFVATADGDHVTIWDPDSWEERWHLPNAAGRISSCAASPDGRLLAIGGRETEQDRTTVAIWDAERWEVVTALSGGEGAAKTLAFGPDGSRLLLAHGAVVSVVDTETWEPVGRIDSPANDLAWGPDGSFVVSCDRRPSLSIWEADGWTLRATLEGHEDTALTCAVSPDGTVILSGGLDDTLNVWDVDRALRGDEVVPRPPPAALDGDRGTPSGRPTSWDLATGALAAPDDVVAISPDGSFAVTDAGSILDTETRAEISRLTDVRYPGRNVAVFAADVSPDGSVVVTTKDRVLRAWDPRTGRELVRFEGHTGHVNDCAISPDGRFLLSASYDTTLRIWNLATGEELRKLRGHVEVSFQGRGDVMQVMFGTVRGAMACAWSPDGSFIVSAGADGSVRIWDPRRGRTGKVWGSASRSVESCAVTPDAGYVVSADDRRVLLVNEAATGEARAVLVGPENVVAHPGRPRFGTRTARGFVEIEAIGLEYGPLVALVAAEGAWRCPACREVAAGPKARAGRTLACPTCGTTLRIPDLRRHRPRRSLAHRARRPIARRRPPSLEKQRQRAESEPKDPVTRLQEWSGTGGAEVEVVVRPWEPQWWLLRRADFDKVESRKRTGWTVGSMLILIALVAGGALVYAAVRSAAVAIAAPLLAANLVGRFRYVLRRPRKIRRSVYSLVAPGAGVGLAILLHTWAGIWWLAVPLGLALGWVISVPVRRLFFPGIVEEGL